jgi:hypothetical protein
VPADNVVAPIAGEQSVPDQLTGQPVGRGRREPGAARHRGEREVAVVLVERAEKVDNAADHARARRSGIACHGANPSTQQKYGANAGWERF